MKKKIVTANQDNMACSSLGERLALLPSAPNPKQGEASGRKTTSQTIEITSNHGLLRRHISAYTGPTWFVLGPTDASQHLQRQTQQLMVATGQYLDVFLNPPPGTCMHFVLTLHVPSSLTALTPSIHSNLHLLCIIMSEMV
jgi:phosphoenolpyruvate carboxylase